LKNFEDVVMGLKSYFSNFYKSSLFVESNLFCAKRRKAKEWSQKGLKGRDSFLQSNSYDHNKQQKEA